MKSRRRTSLFIAAVLVAAALGAYAILFTEWGRSLRPSGAAAACAALPKAIGGALEAHPDDCVLAERTLRQALATAPDGAITSWTSLRSGARGTIRLAPAPARDGKTCRRAALTVTRGDKTERLEVVACLDDGRWTLVE